jgi:putative ABC transport system substrate-binding protein
MCRRAANYVDRIFKGTKRGELPIDRTSTFEFVVNLKAAKALGITIPPVVMVRTTKAME